MGILFTPIGKNSYTLQLEKQLTSPIRNTLIENSQFTIKKRHSQLCNLTTSQYNYMYKQNHICSTTLDAKSQ